MHDVSQPHQPLRSARRSRAGRLLATAAVACLLAVGWMAAVDTDGCRTPPQVDCARFAQPTPRFWRTNDDEEAAARATVGIRTCTHLIGQPLHRAIELYGKPFPQDGTGFATSARFRRWGWQTASGMYIAYDRSPERRIKRIVLMADNAASSDTGWNYCGAPWRQLAGYESGR